MFASATGYSDFNWIQSVTSTAMAHTAPGKTPMPFNDLQPGHESENAPFYLSTSNKEYATNHGRDNGYSTYFHDSPGTGSTQTANYYFDAELTLMGKKNGIYTPLITFSWGYFFFLGKAISFGPFITNPSTFQKSLFPSKP